MNVERDHNEVSYGFIHLFDLRMILVCIIKHVSVVFIDFWSVFFISKFFKYVIVTLD